MKNELEMSKEEAATALSIAIMSGEVDSVTSLLEEFDNIIDIPNAIDKTPFDVAIEHERFEIVELLIKKMSAEEASYRTKSKYYLNKGRDNAILELSMAIGFNDVEKIKLILRDFGDIINTLNYESNPPLIVAIQSKQLTTSDLLSIIELLIEAGAEVDKPNKKGSTALICAAELGQLEAAELLVKYGANINYCNFFGNTPLSRAATNGHFKIIEFLVGRDDITKDTDLMLYATMIGEFDLVKALIKGGIPSEKEGRKGSTLMHVIASKQWNVWNGKGEKINVWCEEKQLYLVRLLIQNKADVNYIDMRQSVLQCAIVHSDAAALLLMENREVDINLAIPVKPNIFTTALSCAFRMQKFEIAELLINHPRIHFKTESHDYDNNTFSASKCTFLMSIIYDCRKSMYLLKENEKFNEIFNILLNLIDVLVNEMNTKGTTALMLAASQRQDGNDFFIRKLIDNGADINMQDKSGKTALMHAIVRKNSTSVQILINENGIDIHIQDQRGKTALMHAAECFIKEGESVSCEILINILVSEKMNFDIEFGDNIEKWSSIIQQLQNNNMYYEICEIIFDIIDNMNASTPELKEFREQYIKMLTSEKLSAAFVNDDSSNEIALETKDEFPDTEILGDE